VVVHTRQETWSLDLAEKQDAFLIGTNIASVRNTRILQMFVIVRIE